MDRGVGAAVRPLPEGDRKDLAIHALAGSETVSDLAARHGVSRKFVYRQAHKASAVLDEAFSPAVRDDEVLFELAVTGAWLRQVIVALTLICRSSYRGGVEFLRDLLGLPVSLGHVHDVLQAATRQASVVNDEPDLSGIRVGLHDEIFQAPRRCWPASMRHRPTAISWRRSSTATPTPGACTCSTLRSGGCGPTTPSPMPGGAYAPGSRQPGATRRATATCSTSSAGARALPERCRALPRAPPRAAKRCRPGSAAPVSGIQMARLSSSSSRPVIRRLGRRASPATSERSSSGCATTFWPWPARTWRRGGSCSTSSPPS